ncbi:hypothetical protein ACHWQZ_G003276 [Mnemiopsis leidyi]
MSSILLLGDILVDKNFHGSANTLAPEAAVPTVEVETTSSSLGGIGNVVRSLTDFFEDVHFVSSFWEEDARMIGQLLGEQVNFVNFEQKERRMVVINRVFVGNQMISRFDYPSKRTELSKENEDQIVEYIQEKLLSNLDAILLSDYDRGFLTEGLCVRVIQICREAGVTVLVDPILPDWSKFRGANLIKPNREEANRFISHEKIKPENFANTAMKKYGFSYILQTLDDDGMILYRQTEDKSVKSTKRNCAEVPKLVDVNGCGDALLAATAVFLQGYTQLETEQGGLLENREEDLLDVLTEVGRIAVGISGCYILNKTDWTETVLKPRKPNQESPTEKVVFTNGCFDLVHVGHLKLLNYCRGLGGRFIIGINSDLSVKLNKGITRPVNTLECRVKFLKELNLADEIIPFEEKTPIKLIEEIRPDILVKGGDYTPDQVVGRELAGKTVIFPLESGVSSTILIERIGNGIAPKR